MCLLIDLSGFGVFLVLLTVEMVFAVLFGGGLD